MLADVRRFLVWTSPDGLPVEAATIDLTDDGLTARGTQIGGDPLPYRLDYVLDASAGFLTRRLEVHAVGEHWQRRIDLRRDDHSRWTCDADHVGEPTGTDLPAPGIHGDLTDALDCDLGLSPLTNAMPVLRHRLHQAPGAADFVMAWVSVPDLRVTPDGQRYEHVHHDPTGSVVRFTDQDLFPGFTADLTLDPDGLIRDYPNLAHRI